MELAHLIAQYTELKGRLRAIKNSINKHPDQVANRVAKGNEILLRINTEAEVKLDLANFVLVDYDFDVVQDPNTDWRPTKSYTSTFVCKGFTVICRYTEMDADCDGNYKIRDDSGQIIQDIDKDRAYDIVEGDYPDIDPNIIRLIAMHAKDPYPFMEGEYHNFELLD